MPARWLEARRRELLPTPYVHVVFTLPRELAPLALQNKKVIYDLLFHASAKTLLEVALDPKHLGAQIGFFSVLHTWDQKLQLHPHVHCVLPAGGLSGDHTRWVATRGSFFLPNKVLSRVFRGKFVAALKYAFTHGKLGFHGHFKLLARPKVFSSWLRQLFRHDWVVYCKRPFGGPEHVLRYLGSYTHRVANLQSPTGLLEGWPSHVSLEGFRASQPKAADDAADGRVPAPLPVASAAPRLRSHSQFRLPGQPASCCISATLFSVAELRTRISPRSSPGCKRFSGPRFLDVSSLRWTHAGDREAHRRPDPTPFSAPSLRMGRMKPQLRARLIPVFQTRTSCVCLRGLVPKLLYPLHQSSRTAPPTKPNPTFSSRQASPSDTELHCLVFHPQPHSTPIASVAPATSFKSLY